MSAQDGPMPLDSAALYQLIYVSSATRPIGDSELAQILRGSRRHNLARGVTGMLLYHESLFLQVLEGPKQEVLRLYARIERDARHVNARVLHRGEIDERSFRSWSMGFYKTTASSPAELEGFVGLLSQGFAEEVRREPGLAQRILLNFRQGQWHARVQAGAPGFGSVA
jgi:hypothetical protein